MIKCRFPIKESLSNDSLQKVQLLVCLSICQSDLLKLYSTKGFSWSLLFSVSLQPPSTSLKVDMSASSFLHHPPSLHVPHCSAWRLVLIREHRHIRLEKAPIEIPSASSCKLLFISSHEMQWGDKDLQTLYETAEQGCAKGLFLLPWMVTRQQEWLWERKRRGIIISL